MEFGIGLPEGVWKINHCTASKETLLGMNNEGVVIAMLMDNVGLNTQGTVRAAFTTLPYADSCAQVDERHIYVSDPSQMAILKYSLTGKVVHVLETSGLHLPWIIGVDAKRNRLYVFDSSNMKLSMFSNDKLQWSTTKLLEHKAFAVREQDGKVFFIGQKFEEDYDPLDSIPLRPIFYPLMVLDPCTGE